MNKRTRLPSTPTIDLTPMLDVVFIMLIFFIVTANFMKEKSVEITRAPDIITLPPTEPSHQLVFRITSGDQLFENGQLIDIWSAEALIKKMHTEQPDWPIIITPEVGASLGMMVRLYDGARLAGLIKEHILIK